MFWRGEFGDAYVDRNQVRVEDRLPFWRSICHRVQPDSVLEVGCNRGHNLAAIGELRPYAWLTGVDVNAKALEEAAETGMIDDVRELPADRLRDVYESDTIDLVFTAGVLIHIPPEDLARVVSAMVDVSGQYVLAIEYEDIEEVEVNYRGHAERLWRRPYGDVLHAHGVSIIETGPAIGFDQCTYWLGEKR
jgi:pseudaminic acid biosynthesis-associated methylase